jgi:hypothetical protein
MSDYLAVAPDLDERGKAIGLAEWLMVCGLALYRERTGRPARVVAVHAVDQAAVAAVLRGRAQVVVLPFAGPQPGTAWLATEIHHRVTEDAERIDFGEVAG